MKWLGGALLAVALFAGGYLTARAAANRKAHQAEAALAHADSLFKETTDSLHSVIRHATQQRDSALASERQNAIRAAQAGRIVDSLRNRVATAETGYDSLRLYPLLVAQQDSQIGYQDSQIGNLRVALTAEIEHSAALTGQLMAERVMSHAKDSLIHALSHVPPPVPLPRPPFVLRVAETAGIGLATLAACRDHLLSLGCGAGVAVLVGRVR